jgi:pimeloyl-ACP methyl ester carboxylesterase
MPRPPRIRKHAGRRGGLSRLTGNLRNSRALLDRTRQHVRDRIVFYLLVVAGLAVFGVAGWPFLRAHMQAIAILQLVSGKPVPAVVGYVVGQPVRVENIMLHVESGDVRARLYLPEHKPNAPALVVLHGVHHLGIDEPRLTSFASAMASCGIRVLTPELPDIMDYHVGSASIRTIGESTRWFAQRTGGPVGVMGLSFSGGLSLIAAADPLYHPDFKFVFAVGSQDSMGRVVQYYRTGADERPNGTIEELPAHEYGPLVIEYEYVEDFVPARDVPVIRAVLRAHLYEDKAAEAEAEAKLNPAQAAMAKELMDGYSPKTRAMIEAVSMKHIADMDSLSPSGSLGKLTTPVYLLHGEGDNIIPSAETLWMASQLPRETLQAMLVSPVISHIDMDGKGVGAMDEWRLIHFFALVMHAVEAPSGRRPWL